MSARATYLSVVGAIVVLCSAGGTSAQSASLSAVLERASAYVTELSEKLQIVGAEESALQKDVGGNKINLIARLSSDVVFVGVRNGTMGTYRDTYAVDTKATRPRDDRLFKLFLNPPEAPVTSTGQAVRLSEDSGVWYVSRNLQMMDDPLAALALLRAAGQAGATFKLDGVRKSDGVDVAQLKFNETATPSVLRTPAGIPVSGRFWIEAGTGIVRQTEIILSNKAVNSRYTVKFAQEPTIGLWLPKELHQYLQISTAGSGGPQTIGSQGSFESMAVYAKYRQVPIDLSRIR
jgi:hypothetical protein